MIWKKGHPSIWPQLVRQLGLCHRRGAVAFFSVDGKENEGRKLAYSPTPFQASQGAAGVTKVLPLPLLKNLSTDQ